MIKDIFIKKLLFVCIIFFAIVSIQVQAGALKKSHNTDSLKIELDDGEAIVSLSTRLSLDTIAGAPKIVCSGTWKFHYAIIGGRRYDTSNLPVKVINGLKLYNLDILYGVGSLESIIDAGVECDPGAFYKSGSSKSSFTTPASPDWSKTFRPNEDHNVMIFYGASKAKAHLKHLRAKGELPSEAAWYGGVNVLNASLNVFSIRQYIKEKEKKETDEFEDMLGDTEESVSSSGRGFNEMFDDTENSNVDTSDLSSDLDQIEKADTAQRQQRQRYKKLAPVREKRDSKLAYCENGKPANIPFQCSMSYEEGSSGLHLTATYRNQSDAAKQRRKSKAEQAKRRKEEEARERAIYNKRVASICKGEKDDWSRLKDTFSERLQAWRDSREQCIRNAYKSYRADVRRLEEEEKRVEKDLEGLVFE